MFVSLYVMKDINNPCTDMVPIISKASHPGPEKVYNYFGEGISTILREIEPEKKSPVNFYFKL